jgi:hypothetical protein
MAAAYCAGQRPQLPPLLKRTALFPPFLALIVGLQFTLQLTAADAGATAFVLAWKLGAGALLVLAAGEPSRCRSRRPPSLSCRPPCLP